MSWHVEEIIKEQADGGSGLSLSRRGRNLNQPRADEGDDGRIPSTRAGHDDDGAGSSRGVSSGRLGRPLWWTGMVVVRPSQPSSSWRDEDLGAEARRVVLPSADPPVQRGGRLVEGFWRSAGGGS